MNNDAVITPSTGMPCRFIGCHEFIKNPRKGQMYCSAKCRSGAFKARQRERIIIQAVRALNCNLKAMGYEEVKGELE